MEDINLPGGYTPVDFISNELGGYIDTGVQPIPNATKIYIDLRFNELSDTVAVLGARNSQTSYNTSCAIFYLLNSSPSKTGLRVDWVDKTKFTTVRAGERYEITCCNQTCSINDNTFAGTTTKSAERLSSTITLGTVNTNNSKDTRVSNISIYSCKIWDENNNLIRDFYPCHNSSLEYGLYDIVTSTFYTGVNYNLTGGDTESNKKLLSTYRRRLLDASKAEQVYSEINDFISSTTDESKTYLLDSIMSNQFSCTIDYNYDTTIGNMYVTLYTDNEIIFQIIFIKEAPYGKTKFIVITYSTGYTTIYESGVRFGTIKVTSNGNYATISVSHLDVSNPDYTGDIYIAPGYYPINKCKIDTAGISGGSAHIHYRVKEN